MGKQLDSVTADALKLAPEDRVELAERLLSSVFSDQRLEDAWADEVERRIEAIESGRAQLIPAAEAVARARATIK